jgi:2-polyprenyl-6-methoxyphenol hydroxylase-like FAD-dependent oxidoreductase
VFGAGGRHGPIGRQVGLRLDVDSHHWGAGCIVEGLESWPAGVQAFGTEGRRNFMVFPQGGGRARLYLNVGREDARRYSGPYGTRAFLGDFALECLPPELAQLCVDASPLGKAGAGPILRTRMERPFTAGVVLIGDEAGCNDSVLGTGLSCALDDAANVTRLLMDNTVWGASLFEEYALRRNERQKKLHFAAEFYFRLFCEFGPEPRARRARVFERIAANPNFGALQAVPLAGPYRTPSFAFSELLLDRLFGERPTSGSGQAKRRFVLTG